MWTIDFSRSRLNMTCENSFRLAGSPVRRPASTSGPPTTLANVAPRTLASRSASSRLTTRETNTVAMRTSVRTSRLTAMNRRSARRTAAWGRALPGSGGGVDIDQAVPPGDGHRLQLRVRTELGQQALDVATARVARDAYLA